MAGKKQIADLHARLTADVTQYDAEMKKAAAVSARTQQRVNRSFDQMSKKGLQFGAGLLGASTAIILFTNLVRDAIRDVEKIPGLDPQIVQSVQMARSSMGELEVAAKSLAATVVAKFVEIGQGIGFGLGALFFGDDAAADAFTKAAEEARTAYQRTEQHQKALAKATRDLSEAERDLANAAETKGEGADRKRAEAEAARNTAAAIRDELERKLALIEAHKLEASAIRDTVAIKAQMEAAQSAAGRALQPIIGASLKGQEAIDALQAGISRLQHEIAGLDTSTAAGMEAAAARWKQVKQNADELNKLLEKTPAKQFDREMALMWNNVSDRAGQAFADMVLTGEASFSQLADIVARSMLEIVARMAIINPLLNLTFGGLKGFTTLPAFFADGGRPPVGRASIVGEEGPELFVPDSAGTIIPNHKLAPATDGGGDTFTVTYNIASGVSRQELIPVLEEHGRRTIADMHDLQRRRRL